MHLFNHIPKKIEAGKKTREKVNSGGSSFRGNEKKRLSVTVQSWKDARKNCYRVVASALFFSSYFYCLICFLGCQMWGLPEPSSKQCLADPSPPKGPGRGGFRRGTGWSSGSQAEATLKLGVSSLPLETENTFTLAGLVFCFWMRSGSESSQLSLSCNVLCRLWWHFCNSWNLKTDRSECFSEAGTPEVLSGHRQGALPSRVPLTTSVISAASESNAVAQVLARAWWSCCWLLSSCFNFNVNTSTVSREATVT